MGLVLDTSIVVAAERQSIPIVQVVRSLPGGDARQILLAAISVVELTHGMYRAKTDAQRERRSTYLNEVLRAIDVAALTLPIAQMAGRIDGEQAAVGNKIDLADLLIGATALHFGYEVATYNAEHFRRIPGVRVVVPEV